jgi:hypothetical protein
MSNPKQARSYCVHGTKLQVLCSAPMAIYLDARFRLLPPENSSAETTHFDFHAATDSNQHAIKKPQGDGRPFYEIPKGEACYFTETDEVYISFQDRVRALYKPRVGCVVVSTVESDPRNLFTASHLVLTILLVEILRRRGWYSLHAAGFSDNGRALLIPGTSGSGKSTLTVALLRAKFDYLSDDMVFLGRRADGLAVRGLVEDVDVCDQTIGFFPELDFLLRSPKTEGFPKRQLRPEEVYGAKVVAEADPKALILPRISGKESSVLTRITGDEAFLEIVPNVLLTEAHTSQGHLGALAELVKRAVCYRLDTGRDFSHIPIVLRELLSCDPEKVCV